MSALLLLTKHFPYNNGKTAAEAYLETEIGHLSAAFDQVLVVATEAGENIPTDCFLPDNVSSVSLGVSQNTSDKLILGLRGLVGKGSKLDRVAEVKASEGRLGFAKKLFLGYFLSKANEKYRKLNDVLAQCGFAPTHIYSFWLFDTALVEAWLKNLYPELFCFARAHRYDLYEERNAFSYIPARRYILDSLDKVFPCSNDGADYLRRRYPLSASRVEAVYLGTRNMPDKSDDSGSHGSFSVVSCSRLVPVKRVTLLAEAMSILDEEGVDIVWTHYGDGPELKKVRRIASRFTEVRASFPGNVPNELLLERYGDNHFDLFVNVSLSEGLPLSIMEACGSGIPVLATDVGGTHEIVREGVNGVLLSPSVDAAFLAGAIKSFYMCGSEAMRKMRTASREMWESSFRAGDNISKMLAMVDGGDCG